MRMSGAAEAQRTAVTVRSAWGLTIALALEACSTRTGATTNDGSDSGSTSGAATSDSGPDVPPGCGDGILQSGEDCDDGNDVDNDGCDSDCIHSKVESLVAGGAHTCVLFRTGSVRCWGRGTEGQLGYGNTAHIGDDELPATAGDVNVGGKVVQLAAGGAHTCALLETGAVRCWGSGRVGALGYGNEEYIGDDEEPADAGDVDLGGKAVQVAAGGPETCALLEDGTLRCWGSGMYGQPGYGSTEDIGDDETPASMGPVQVGGSVVLVAVGSGHTCAVLDTKAVRCWGAGALGYGNEEHIGDNELPESAGDVPMGGPVERVSAGGSHTCALLEDGGVRCWGVGSDGRLGYGNEEDIGDDEAPTEVGDVDVGGQALQVAAAGYHTCALLEGGNVRCWGGGQWGRLGYGEGLGVCEDDFGFHCDAADECCIGDNETPASAGDVPVGGEVEQLSAGELHTCALLGSGRVRCWGSGESGKLGYGNTEDVGDDESPAEAGDVQVF